MQEKSLHTLEFPKILANLAAEAESAPGRERCEKLQPSTELREVEQRQEETDDMLREILKNGDLALSAFDDLRELISLMVSGSVPGPGAFLRVGRQLRLVARLMGRLPADFNEDELPLCLRRVLALAPCAELEQRIDDCILSEEELKDRASEELYRIRRSIQRFQDEVRLALEKVLRSSGQALQEQVITLRGDRYVIPVKAESRTAVPGIVHDSSSSGATVFIEPMAVVELNNKIREAKAAERKEIERILAELTDEVANRSALILRNQEILTLLDFAQAKARLAIKEKAQRPKLNERGLIRLFGARHPLIPADKVVPIDFELGDRFNTLLITGPNTGGKTVSLKTCGLFCLMAMAGLQLPAAEFSEISIFQEILADIGDEQSIEQSLSTFSSHMVQLIKICELAGPGSLVLTDELGAGTDPVEGAALAISILDFLRSKGCFTVATTHYPELKGYALNTPGVSNACCEFDTKTLRPTYRLLIGVPGVSNALAISRRLGLDESILQQAEKLISNEGRQFEDLLKAIERSHREAKKMEEEVTRLKDQAVQARNELEEEKQRIKEEKARLLNEARMEAQQLLSDAEESIESELKALRAEGSGSKDREEHKLRIRRKAEALAREMGAEKLKAGIDRPLEPEDIVVGQRYQAVLSGFIGQAAKPPDSRGQVLLKNGAISIRAEVSALRPVSDEEAEEMKSAGRKKVRKGVRSATAGARLHTASEIYLLGQKVDEALRMVDSYLDNAQLSGLESVRIVHGKGTGALRQAIRQKLDGDKRVSSYSDAPFGQGDAGVTVVRLKR